MEGSSFDRSRNVPFRKLWFDGTRQRAAFSCKGLSLGQEPMKFRRFTGGFGGREVDGGVGPVQPFLSPRLALVCFFHLRCSVLISPAETSPGCVLPALYKVESAAPAAKG